MTILWHMIMSRTRGTGAYMFSTTWHGSLSILLKEPFALKNSETVYFTSIFSTPSYSDIAPIDNFDLTFFYFYQVCF